MPAPPASARIANTSRTSVASTASRIASPPQTPATTRSCPLRSKRSADTLLTGGSDDIDAAGSDGGVDHQLAAGSLLDSDVPPAFVLIEDVDVADLCMGVDGDGGVARHDDTQLADVDLGLEMRHLGDRADAGEVELQVSDAEVVGGLEGG